MYCLPSLLEFKKVTAVGPVDGIKPSKLRRAVLSSPVVSMFLIDLVKYRYTFQGFSVLLIALFLSEMANPNFPRSAFVATLTSSSGSC